MMMYSEVCVYSCTQCVYMYLDVFIYIHICLPNPIAICTNQQKSSAFLFRSSKDQLHFKVNSIEFITL